MTKSSGAPGAASGTGAASRSERPRKLGILTGGGDCPGLNAVLRACARYCNERGTSLIGYMNGWQGVLEGESMLLDRRAVKGIVHLGGTILGTSRTDPLEVNGGLARMKHTLEEDGVEGLIVVGGDGTLSAALELSREGFNVLGVPKTIDNDLCGTDVTFGFDTAVSIATDAIDRLHTTAEAHKRVIVVEVMGNHSGWIAAYAGIAGGADVVLVPEVPFELRDVCDRIRDRERRGRSFSIVVIAEGARSLERADEPVERRGKIRPGQISFWLADEIEKAIGTETRFVVLGHIQRGGTPTAYDRILATRYGIHAAELAMQGRWGMMVSLSGRHMDAVPLEEAVGQLRELDPAIWAIAQQFG